MGPGSDDRRSASARPVLTSLAFALLPAAGLCFGAWLDAPENGGLTGRVALLAVGLYVGTAIAAYAFLRLSRRRAASANGEAPASPEPARPEPGKILLGALAGFAFMAALSLWIAAEFGLSVAGWFAIEPRSTVIGLAVAAALSLLLALIMNSRIAFIRDFRERQIRLFTERNFDFSFGQVLIMSAGAGMAEEMLFRGALQPVLQGWAGPAGGLALASLAFGLAHAANVGYFLISTVIGLVLGLLYCWTGSLTASMIAHGAYDVYALQVTAVAVRAHKARMAA